MSVVIELSPTLQAEAEALASQRGERVETLLQAAIETFLVSLPDQDAADQRWARNQERLRSHWAARGLNWDTMSETEREVEISQLVHEGRNADAGGF